MRAGGRTHLSTEFVISDQAAGYPRRTVTTTATPEDLDALVRSGYLVRRRLLDEAAAGVLAAAVLRLAEAEEGRPEAEELPGDSAYIRSLLDKDPLFHPLLRLEPALSIARTLLGPQVWIDLEARLNHAGRPGVAVPWHAHLPVIPDPLPPLFSHPHQIHCLIYLDPVTEREGALCLLPGSHRDGAVRIPLGDRSDRDGQVELFFEPGDAVLIHAGLWHRTVPSEAAAGYRRLLLLGFVPSWQRADTGRGVRAERPLTEELARDGDAETRELLGEFQW
ncbi:ectoine hydroxylase [Mycobacterium tuberculosis]|nr:ectoine hydroxylase [Mycobacterium tuberculosis]